jgi:hypothetical protein
MVLLAVLTLVTLRAIAASPEVAASAGTVPPPAARDLSKMLQSIEVLNAPRPTKGDAPTAASAAARAARFGGLALRGVPSGRLGTIPLEKPTDGRWHERPQALAGKVIPEGQDEHIEQLESIGYLSGSEAASGSGVTVHNQARTSLGLNFYSSGHAPAVILMDAAGKALHAWHMDFATVWPDYPKARLTADSYFFRRAYLQPNGDVLAIFEGHGLIRMDKNSKLLWAYTGNAHHDLGFLPTGQLCVLTRKTTNATHINPSRPIYEDLLTVLDLDTGKELLSVSLLDALENSEFKALRQDLGAARSDILHTNTLHVLDGRFREKVPAFKEGNIMVCMRNQDIVAVVDLALGKVVWAKKGPYRRPHDPKIIDNGNLLIFDNLNRAEASAVCEFDPVTMALQWSYAGAAESPIRSRTCGSAHRLPNGNTLITVSDAGYAREVTPEKEVVWEFHNPHHAGEQNQFVATLFNVDRIGPEFPLEWLEPATAQ